MSFIVDYSLGLLILIGCMSILWIISLILKNSSIVDIFWGLGFVISAWFYFFITPDGFFARKWLLSILVTLWGLRLSLYVLWRNWGKPEDFRYQKWRNESGPIWWWKSFFQVFLLQGVLLWIVSIPLLASQSFAQPNTLTWLDGAAVVLWGIGFFFETAGDLQLARFKSNPLNKGKVLSHGVWRYSRHPNYFGDAAQWWAFYLLALAAGAWWVIFSPLIMTFLLVRVSGVALLEKTLETRPGYVEYVQSTSAFIPWFPRSKKGSSS